MTCSKNGGDPLSLLFNMDDIRPPLTMISLFLYQSVQHAAPSSDSILNNSRLSKEKQN